MIDYLTMLSSNLPDNPRDEEHDQ